MKVIKHTSLIMVLVIMFTHICLLFAGEDISNINLAAFVGVCTIAVVQEIYNVSDEILEYYRKMSDKS